MERKKSERIKQLKRTTHRRSREEAKFLLWNKSFKKKVTNLSSLLVGYVVPLQANNSFGLQENSKKGSMMMS